MNGYHIEEDFYGFDWYIQAGKWIALVLDYTVVSCENKILILKNRDKLTKLSFVKGRKYKTVKQ